jgi:regulator of protease activity HflC (stomatin/prohibitin superfamily)
LSLSSPSFLSSIGAATGAFFEATAEAFFSRRAQTSLSRSALASRETGKVSSLILAPRSGESGKITGGLLGAAVVVLIVGTIVFYTFGQVVAPGYIGVRQVTAGPGQGFSKNGLRPGLHFTVPFLVNVYLIPRTVQVLNFHRKGTDSDIASVSNDPDEVASLEIRTSDGLSVDLDVSVLTRFYDRPSANVEEGSSESGVAGGKDKPVHGGPADLFTAVGISEAAWDNQIRRVAADELRQALGALLARQFYEEPATRAEALARAQDAMRERLDPVGIRVEAVLLRRYTYKDDLFDKAIFNKNLQEQEQRLKDASGRLAEVKAQLEQVEAEWDAKVETLRVKGESESKVLFSEAKLYESQKMAEGDLLVAKAQAEVDRLKAAALAQSTGADVFVAREMAPLLSSLKGGVVTSLDPYDVDAWARRLGVGESSKAKLKSAPSPAAASSVGASAP